MPFLREMLSMAANIFSAYTTVAVAASMMLLRWMANDVFPEPVKAFVGSVFSRFFRHFFNRFFNKLMTIVVDENDGIMRNQIYDDAEIYLRTKINAERLKANKSTKQKNINLSMVKDQEVVDFYEGFEVKWQFVLVEPEGDRARFQSEKRYFEVTFEKINKETVVNEYLPFVLAKAKEIKENERAVKLYTM